MIIFHSQRRLKTLFKFKDSLPDELQSFIVYKFTCGACNSSYVGKTDRHRHIRWCEHLKLQPFRGGPSKSKQKPTSVELHKTTTGHETLYENFEVIGREKSRNTFFLKIKESLLIKKLAPSLNDQDSSIPLSLFKWGDKNLWKQRGVLCRGGWMYAEEFELFFDEFLQIWRILYL